MGLQHPDHRFKSGCRLEMGPSKDGPVFIAKTQYLCNVINFTNGKRNPRALDINYELWDDSFYLDLNLDLKSDGIPHIGRTDATALSNFVFSHLSSGFPTLRGSDNKTSPVGQVEEIDLSPLSNHS